MSLSWFIDGIIIWRKSKPKPLLLYRSFKPIFFFLSLSNWRRSCRKVILTAGSQVKSYPFLKTSVSEKKCISPHQDFIGREDVVIAQHFIFPHMFMIIRMQSEVQFFLLFKPIPEVLSPILFFFPCMRGHQ